MTQGDVMFLHRLMTAHKEGHQGGLRTQEA